MKIAIIGAGTFGVTLASILSKNNKITIFSIIEKEIGTLNKNKAHPYFPKMILNDNVTYTTNINKAINNADAIILATPSIYIRNMCSLMKDIINDKQIIVCVAKGIENKTLYTMSEVIADEIKKNNKIVALSGPTHAEEIAIGLPTLIVSSSSDIASAMFVQNLFVGTCIRPYTNFDIKGVELCGALKNIIALACGIATGLGYEDNTKAAIITRGLAEISNLGLKMGCKLETFSGLAGVGDLIVTCTSVHSRNYTAGIYIGQGMNKDEAINKVGMVVESIYALPAAISLANKYNVEMPIIECVNKIIDGKISPSEAVSSLFSRSVRDELGYESNLLEKND